MRGPRTLTLGHLDLKPGDVVLDLGCGPGLWTPLLAEKVKPNGRVTGLDFSPDLIDYAVENLGKGPLRDIMEFIEADFYSIPFEDDTFDVIFFGNCVAYVRDAFKVLEEQKRVTKKGEKLLLKILTARSSSFTPSSLNCR